MYFYTLQFNLIPLVAKTTFHIFIHLNLFYFIFYFISNLIQSSFQLTYVSGPEKV